jgi:hypothetical protein
MLRSGGRILFGLYDTASQKGRWLPVNEENEGWRIVSFDEAQRQLTVVIQGNSLVLPLREPKFEGSPGGGAVASGPQAVPQAPAAVTPADEAARLKAVAEEIKRRRQLRQKQMQQQAQPPAPGQTPASP